MNIIKSMFQVFIYVTAGNTIGAAIYITLFSRKDQFSYQLLWQIIGIAAVCALSNLIFMSKYELSKKQIILRYVIHYIYINIVVIGGAVLFRWINQGETVNIVFMFVLVAVIYACIITLISRHDFKIAEDLNEKLSKYNKGI